MKSASHQETFKKAAANAAAAANKEISVGVTPIATANTALSSLRAEPNAGLTASLQAEEKKVRSESKEFSKKVKDKIKDNEKDKPKEPETGYDNPNEL